MNGVSVESKKQEKINQLIDLTQSIDKGQAKVAVVGVGYIGLTFAVQVADYSLCVWAIDNNEIKIDKLRNGQSYISDVSKNQVSQLVEDKKLIPTKNISKVSEADVIVICVPTPLNKNKEPDISIIKDVTYEITKYIIKGQLILLESTTYPGTTSDVVLPILESNGLKVGEDICLGYSPERVDFGNKKHARKDIPKIVSGLTEVCKKITDSFYSKFIKTVPVSSTEVAEMAKTFENAYRSVNIGLVNEMAILCDRMNINVWEVLDGAFTKPYGIQPFYPGPGVGGHCIPVDPYYLSWKAREYDYSFKFIELAGDINDNMPYFVLHKLTKALNEYGKSINKSKVLMIGVAYKQNISDYRLSPAVKIIELIKNRNADVSYYDPYIPKIKIGNKCIDMLSIPKLDREILESFDVVIITTNHSLLPLDEIVEYSSLIIDTKNSTKYIIKNKEHVVLL